MTPDDTRAVRADGWPALRAREVHLWWIEPEALDSADPAAWSTLSAAEHQRAARQRTQTERLRLLRRRRAMRAILGRYLAMPPQDVVFQVGPFGKPALATRHGENSLSFNLSRSGDAAVLAVARGGRVGVDVERLRALPEMAAVIRHTCSDVEARALAAMAEGERTESFFRIWTRKEAVVKALGGGLAIALDAFDVSCRRDEPPAITQWRLAGAMRGTLRLLPVDAVQGHAIALAAEAPADMCRLLRWPGSCAMASAAHEEVTSVRDRCQAPVGAAAAAPPAYAPAE